MIKAYEYRHIVGFQETNLVGNVYYTNHLAWQGRCREMFLRDNAPAILDELGKGLSLATINCSCEYFAELRAFDEIILRMRLLELGLNRIKLSFDYFRGNEPVARGEQTVACMKREGERLSPTHLPNSLREALAAYSS
jgi:enediyne biosynthesis thioesterase